MEEAVAARYWCHLCSQMVSPIMEAEIKCPVCNSGFVEEMSSTSAREIQNPSSNFDSERALSLWAPVLLGMMGDTHRRRRLRREHFDFDDEDDDGEARVHGDESELDREIEFLIRRRRRSSAAILQLLQGIQSGMASELANSEGDTNRGTEREREREHVVLVNNFNEAFVIPGSYDGHNQNRSRIGSLGDYFIGPGLDMLLQHLAENDPNRYGTPPAQKEAIEALPTVTIKEHLQCSVCLDDLEVGIEAKEMPCKHKFHNGCLIPWLELHSSCPVCRFQLPSDESKLDSDTSTARTVNQDESEIHSGHESHSSQASSSAGEAGEEATNGNARRFSFPWPFNSLFSSSSSSSSHSAGTNSSATRNNSPTDEN